MSSLINKRIILGITGGIAAYKSAELARRLRESGAQVRVIMTRAAEEFITVMTMQAVSGHTVSRHHLQPESESGMDHIELARWGDAIIVAPATGNFIAKLANGVADDLLTTVCAAADSPVAIAPAMNKQMWDNPATRKNIAALNANGVLCFGPASGNQACGDIGDGRMLEAIELVDATSRLFKTGVLANRKVIITAGPTWEALDPVRALTNHSSGKMGYAIAEACVEAGAHVILISGPTSLPDPEHVHKVDVNSAEQMQQAVNKHLPETELFIAAAAVADYRPRHVSQQKIKKDAENLTLELVKNPDILAEVAALETVPYIVGFAAETDDLEKNGRQKLLNKKIDLIAANKVGGDIGFNTDDNALLLIDHNSTVELDRQPKSQLARKLVHSISEKFNAKNTTKNSRQTNR